MSKAIVRIGYDTYVIDTKDALVLADVLSKAELYKEVWRKVEDGGTTHHIWEQEEAVRHEFTIKPIPDSVYKMYKLAGKPQEN